MNTLDVARAAELRAGPVRGVEHAFHCERHDDKHASLLINEKKNCWMCAPCGGRGNAWALAAFLAGVEPSNKPAVASWLRDHGLSTRNSGEPRAQIVETYPYTDEEGRLLYEVVRLKPKGFRQRRPDGREWAWNMNGVRRVLYRLPEVLQAVDVFLVEGEKDANALKTIGVTATTNAGGAGKWTSELTAQLQAHQHIVIIPDNDEPGRKHAQQVAAALVGKVASVKILELPGLSEKGADVSDWLAAGGNRDQLEVLAQAAPEFRPDSRSEDRNVMRFTRMGDLLTEHEEEIVWLWLDHLPMCGDSLMVAKPKVGKSTWARCLCLKVSRGDDFMGRKTAQGSVFYLALEEKRAEVRRHFRAMGARSDDPIFVFCAASPDDGLAQLREAMKSEKPVLVVVDPLFRFVRVKDGNDYAAVTNALEPLHNLARESGAHVMAVHHMGKGDRQGGDAVLGSTALFAAVDTLLIMKRSDRFRTLSSIQRYGTDLEEITLSYDEETRTLSAGVARAEADQTEAVKVILEFLATQPEPVEESTIHDSVEGRKKVMVKALRQAVKDGTIIRTGAGKKNDTYRYSVPCSPVPLIYREQTKQESENHVSHSTESPDACSRLFAGSEQVSETREPAFSNTEREEFEL